MSETAIYGVIVLMVSVTLFLLVLASRMALHLRVDTKWTKFEVKEPGPAKEPGDTARRPKKAPKRASDTPRDSQAGA